VAKVSVIQADITTLDVDAIVNAANTSLLVGGGVDGAIHRKAGPELAMACRMLHGCKTGDAKLTKGFKLPARWVIHTVGPVWNGGDHGERDLLASCYRRSLEITADKGFETVAFPAISTGIYRFPADEAAAIAVRKVTMFKGSRPTEVIFCCFDAASADRHRAALESTDA